jgi:sugar lactone lactonase YvrE
MPARALRSRPIAALAALAVAAPAVAAAAAPPAAYTLPGDRVFPEGVAVQPSTGRFFVGSTTDGAVFRGRLDSPSPRRFLAPGAGGRTTAVGLEVDGAGRLVVAGGATGRVFVHDAGSGRLLHVFSNGLKADATFLNDVAATPAGDVYVTDSATPTIWRIPAAALGGPRRAPLEPWLDLRGTAFRYTAAFPNANGIEPTPDGRALLVVQSGEGALFRIGLADKKVTRVAVRGGSLVFGDGLLRVGRDLYVVRNRAGAVARVRMSPAFTSGRVTALRRHPSFAFPTTIARAGGRLLVVNAQFDKREPPATPTLPFTVSSIPLR